MKIIYAIGATCLDMGSGYVQEPVPRIGETVLIGDAKHKVENVVYTITQRAVSCYQRGVPDDEYNEISMVTVELYPCGVGTPNYDPK